MAGFNDKITLSVAVKCDENDRAVIAERVEDAVFAAIAEWNNENVLGTEVRVVG